MPEDENVREPSISEEAETMARAARERYFQSRIPRISDQIVAAQMADFMGRAMGLDRNVPPEVEKNLQLLSDQLTKREPPPLDRSEVPPTGE